MSFKTYEFDAIIHEVPDIDGAYVKFPYNVKTGFGRGRVKAHAISNGISYDGSVVNVGIENTNGSVCYIVGLRKDIRTKIGKQSGDSVHVTVQERDRLGLPQQRSRKGLYDRRWVRYFRKGAGSKCFTMSIPISPLRMQVS